MKKILGIYGSDGGYRFHSDRIEFGSIGRADFDRFIDKSLVDLRRIFLAPLKPDQSMALQTDRFDLVVNYIADMDVNPVTLGMASTLCDAMGDTTVLNPPAAIALSGRHDVSAALEGLDGFVVPKCELVPAGTVAELVDHIADLSMSWPLMVRPIGTQTGHGLNRFTALDDLRRHYGKLDQSEILVPHYVTEYVEHRSADGIYRKVRYFVVDGVGYPQHIYMAKDWPVHGASRRGLLLEREDLRLEERGFLGDPGSYENDGLAERFPEMRDRLGLDYFGIDLNFMEDGRTLLFEANAAMTLSGADHFPPGYEYIEPAREAIITAINEMLLKDR